MESAQTPTKLVVANWKMHGDKTLVDEFANAFKHNSFAAKVVFCVPFTLLAHAEKVLSNVGAQDVSFHVKGAYTGEISASMLKASRCDFVIVGHSERRQYHNESSETVVLKAKAALDENLTPIVCVGENLQQRQSGQAENTVLSQLLPLLNGLSVDELKACVIAYEPVWAIGTGVTATPQQAQQMHAYIRQQLVLHAANLKTVPLLYGGSVKAENAQSLFSQDDIDGGLVGGASLILQEFMAICNAIN